MDQCNGWSSISFIFSGISILSWMCAQLPQIITNYHNKSTEGISPLFLLLWFLGDFLSFSSCLLNDVVLKFQLYSSIFFLCNDITLGFQYYYYNSVYPRSVYVPLNNSPVGAGTVKSAVVTAGLVSASNAMPLLIKRESETSSEKLGLFLAWCCTIVYISSRCPQLWKNYKRKSVEGINSILFGAALVGNLTYSMSILTSCELISSTSKSSFLIKELPYILGSSGTCIFDVFYFYQRYLYRGAGINTTQMSLVEWDR